MSKVNLSFASKAQMVQYARAHLGMELNEADPAAVLRAAIQSARPGIESIETNIEGEPVPVPVKRLDDDSREAAAELKGVTVRVMIPASEEPGGDLPVPLGVNGTIVRVERGVYVDLPVAYFGALKHAEKILREPMANGNPGPARRAPSYPFMVDGPIPEGV